MQINVGPTLSILKEMSQLLVKKKWASLYGAFGLLEFIIKMGQEMNFNWPNAI